MELTVQRRLAAEVMGCSPKKVWFDPDKLAEIKEAITKADIRGLMNSGLIQQKPTKGISKGRARHLKHQKRKGRRKGHGSRKGTATARLPRKKVWISKVRLQREFIRTLKDKKLVTLDVYHDLYQKSKGGFFRNKRHIKIYLEERGILKK
jgi:large subunit ribosomal protein L19e